MTVPAVCAGKQILSDPMAHPVNIRMVALANYTFGDFFKVGWRLTIISFARLLAGMALFWGLR